MFACLPAEEKGYVMTSGTRTGQRGCVNSGRRRDVRHNGTSTTLWMFLFAVRLLQTVRKGKIVLLRKPPNLAACTMCLSFDNVKTELRINAFYGAVHIPCSASATAKKNAPPRCGFIIMQLRVVEGCSQVNRRLRKVPQRGFLRQSIFDEEWEEGCSP